MLPSRNFCLAEVAILALKSSSDGLSAVDALLRNMAAGNDVGLVAKERGRLFADLGRERV